MPHIFSSPRPRAGFALPVILAALLWAVTGANGRAATTAAPPAPAPIVVLTNPADPFSTYYGEILRAEGLNEFDSVAVNTLSADTLAGRDAVLLPPTPVTPAQAQILSDFVTAGGNLIAFRPDKNLAGLLGLGTTASTLSNAYYKIDTSQPPGQGITADTMQFHGTADRWTLNGATPLATLYATSTTASADPAVTLRPVGAAGGQAAAFSFDAARSVVYTRQGNPAWAGQDRDAGIDTNIRSDDLFFGAKVGDVQPDWVDLTKVRIPQADELQRLIANLITRMDADRTPLPRFWYLPRGYKAAVVMTGDDHNTGGTIGQFNRLLEESPAGCSVERWTCPRATSYMFPLTPITDTQVKGFQDEGFEPSLHPDTGCAPFTHDSLEAVWTTLLASAKTRWPSLLAPDSSRTHCVTWSDWASQPKVELEHGVRLDTNYYYWPGSWVKDRPGMFTGSGFPMRFADLDGSTIDVYQATTQMTDESQITIPVHIKALLDGALGANGYYGVFTANMHTDTNDSAGADAIVTEAQGRGVPVISARQLLEWLDLRNGSSFTDVHYDQNDLSFSIATADEDSGLQAMLPVNGPHGTLQHLVHAGADVPTTPLTVKGVAYAVFSATSGDYTATYGNPPPVATPTQPPTSVPAPTPTPGPATPAPAPRTPATKLTKLKVSGTLTVKRGKLRVTFKLSRAAKVRLIVKRRGAAKQSATWTVKGRSGTNTLTIKRKLPTRKTLARGAYTLTASLGAKASSVRFSVR